jgi:hypothetical protein
MSEVNNIRQSQFEIRESMGKLMLAKHRGEISANVFHDLYGELERALIRLNDTANVVGGLEERVEAFQQERDLENQYEGEYHKAQEADAARLYGCPIEEEEYRNARPEFRYNDAGEPLGWC